jgi:cobalt/nickel transport system permease protein
VAALLTAIEFGIQPLLFRDASGAPLYAPYPLSVAIPAMMAGHLTIAGMAEMFVSAGLVAWLQRSHLSLLEATAPGAGEAEGRASGWRAARPLLAMLAVAMLLTPVGILTVGTAWGEWSPGDFSNPAARRQIAAVSGHRDLPAQVPQGLERLARVWTSPFPGYAPPFLRSAAMGYTLSAAFGAGFILLAALLADRAVAARRRVR